MNRLAATGTGGPQPWRSAQLTTGEWMSAADQTLIDALEAAAAELPADPQQWLDVPATAIVNDETAAAVAELSTRLWDRQGFFWLRGLPGDDPAHLCRLFWVLGNVLGDPTMQNGRGEVLSEVTDRFGGAERTADTRGYESNDELRFHCDGGDSIGLACVRAAPVGGGNGLVSLPAVHDVLAVEHPEHLETLRRGYGLYSRREAGSNGEIGGRVNERRIPVFAWSGDRFSAWLNITLAELAVEQSGRGFTNAEREALECVETIAMRPSLQLTGRSEPGDIIWVNNLAVMHRRDRYEDDPDPARRRLLYRMWVNQRGAPPVIAEHAALRAGIRGPHASIGVTAAA